MLHAEVGLKSITDLDMMNGKTRMTPALVIILRYGENEALGIILHLCLKVSDLSEAEWSSELLSNQSSAINSIKGHKDMYIIRNGGLTAQQYMDEIPKSFVVPYAAAIRNEVLHAGDNATPHQTRLVDCFLFEEGVLRMDS